MNKISRTRVRDSVDMTVFGFSHVGFFDVDDKSVMIISIFRGGLLRLVAFPHALLLSALVTLFVAALARVTFEKHTHGLSLILYTSPDYKVAYLHIRVGWRGSLGRAGAQYWTAITGWSVGVVTWMLFSAPDEYEHGALTPSVPESLPVFICKILPRILGVTLTISHPPLSRDYVLGNGGKVVLVPLIPLSFDRDGSSHGQLAGALHYHVTHTQCRARPCPSLETKNWSEGNPALASPESRLSTLLVLLLVALLLPGKSCPRLPARSPRDLPDARSPAPSDTRTPPLARSPPVLAVWVRMLATAGLWARPRRASPPPLQDSLVAPSSHGAHICTRHVNGCIQMRPHLAAHSLKSTFPKTYELTEYLRIHMLGPLLMLEHQSCCNPQANFEQSLNQFRHQSPPHGNYG
ncbi:hypothetical protein EDB83DRAFT_2521142 [Lactarius deliciosus]|nr:hypothetical protein EDB83DRAFT_2521142 [Lactarius deliciosus]